MISSKLDIENFIEEEIVREMPLAIKNYKILPIKSFWNIQIEFDINVDYYVAEILIGNDIESILIKSNFIDLIVIGVKYEFFLNFEHKREPITILRD